MIGVEDRGALRQITLQRPDKANALTEAMLADLLAAVRGAAEQRVLLLTGAGRVYCAGADLDAARAGLAHSPLWGELAQAVEDFPGLSIAALNGTAAGGSLGHVIACDLRLAVPEAKVFYPVMKLGFLPPPADPPRLARLIGAARAKMILLGGQKIGAAEAQGWGLIDRICADPLVEAEAIAADILAAPEGHVQTMKRMIRPLP